jgi:hypothetical protein
MTMFTTSAQDQDQERAEARRQWIADHGSSHLQRLVAEGIECTATYAEEWLARERPDWRTYRSREGAVNPPHDPPAAALDLLDAARKGEPEARLVEWWSADVVCVGYTCMAYVDGEAIVYRVGDDGTPPLCTEEV